MNIPARMACTTVCSSIILWVHSALLQQWSHVTSCTHTHAHTHTLTHPPHTPSHAHTHTHSHTHPHTPPHTLTHTHTVLKLMWGRGTAYALPLPLLSHAQEGQLQLLCGPTCPSGGAALHWDTKVQEPWVAHWTLGRGERMHRYPYTSPLSQLIEEALYVHTWHSSLFYPSLWSMLEACCVLDEGKN